MIARDGACVDCGVAAPLHAHHVKPKSMYPELRFEVSNGVAVCPTCHWKRHQGERLPASRAKKRQPHRATIERKLERFEKMAGRYGEVITGLEAEVARLTEENKRLRRRLGLLSVTEVRGSR